MMLFLLSCKAERCRLGFSTHNKGFRVKPYSRALNYGTTQFLCLIIRSQFHLEVIQACSCNCALIHLQRTSSTQNFVNFQNSFRIESITAELWAWGPEVDPFVWVNSKLQPQSIFFFRVNFSRGWVASVFINTNFTLNHTGVFKTMYILPWILHLLLLPVQPMAICSKLPARTSVLQCYCTRWETSLRNRQQNQMNKAWLFVSSTIFYFFTQE